MKKKNLKYKIGSLMLHESGQMLVIMLMVMVVGMTIGLFLTSRTTTDISLTTKVTDSSRAFSAAEAGIEEAIRDSSALTGTPVPIASGVTYTVTNIPLGSTGIYPPTQIQPIDPGQSLTVWFIAHTATGLLDPSETEVYSSSSIDICFTNNATTTPAVGVTVYYRDGTTLKTSYNGYDPIQSIRPQNSLIDIQSTQIGNCGSSNSYNYRAAVSFNGDFGINPPNGQIKLIAMEIRPLYAASSLAVIPAGGAGGTLPSQGNNITSVGNVGTITRKINVQEPYTAPAPFMSYSVYLTEGELSK